jgi:hypothetical protein
VKIGYSESDMRLAAHQETGFVLAIIMLYVSIFLFPELSYTTIFDK